MFIITGRGVVPSNKIVFLFREMRAFQKILLKQSTHSECVECAILILLKLRLKKTQTHAQRTRRYDLVMLGGAILVMSSDVCSDLNLESTLHTMKS